MTQPTTDKELIELPAAILPLDGTELYYAVQGGNDVAVHGNQTFSLGGLPLTRSQIPSTTITANTIIVSGYSTAGDLGAGATYTSIGAGPTSIGAIQDASGTWFGLVVDQYINVGWFGAKGDYTTDDTAAINAAIAAGFRYGINVYLPGGAGYDRYPHGGRYVTTGPLLVGTTDMAGYTPEQLLGWKMFGDAQASGGGFVGGTSIEFRGTTARGIITMGNGAWRRCEIKDMQLTCATPRAAAYGVLIEDSDTSALKFTSVNVFATVKAFGQLPGPGGNQNGENYVFTQCGAGNVDEFWYTENGQGYQNTFFNCGAGLNAGGAAFHLNGDPSGGGFGLLVYNFNCTFGHGEIPTNCTILLQDACSSTVSFIGGRVENVTTLYNAVSDSQHDACTVTFQSMQLKVDNNVSLGGNTNKAWIADDSHYDTINIIDCQLEGLHGTESVNAVGRIGFTPTYNNGWFALLQYTGCIFRNLAASPSVGITPNTKINGSVYFPGAGTLPPTFLDGVGSFVGWPY